MTPDRLEETWEYKPRYLPCPKYTHHDPSADYTISKIIARGHYAAVKHCHPKKTAKETHFNNSQNESLQKLKKYPQRLGSETLINNAQNCSEKSALTTSSQITSYCIKQISKCKLRNKCRFDDVKNEVAILQYTSSKNAPFIVKLIEVYEDIRQYSLVLEYASGGELYHHLPGKKYFSAETHSLRIYKKWLAQIAQALEWLHSYGIVHLDVKPSNILLTDTCVEKASCVLADFGLSRQIHERVSRKIEENVREKREDFLESTEHLTLLVGTTDYCAPEIFKSTGELDTAVDVFSLGCTLYIMMTGVSPFYDKDTLQTMQNIQYSHPNYSYSIFEDNPASVELLNAMLQKSPKLRCCANDVIICPWLNYNIPSKLTESKISIHNDDHKSCCQNEIDYKSRPEKDEKISTEVANHSKISNTNDSEVNNTTNDKYYKLPTNISESIDNEQPVSPSSSTLSDKENKFCTSYPASKNDSAFSVCAKGIKRAAEDLLSPQPEKLI